MVKSFESQEKTSVDGIAAERVMRRPAPSKDKSGIAEMFGICRCAPRAGGRRGGGKRQIAPPERREPVAGEANHRTRIRIAEPPTTRSRWRGSPEHDARHSGEDLLHQGGAGARHAEMKIGASEGSPASRRAAKSSLGNAAATGTI